MRSRGPAGWLGLWELLRRADVVSKGRCVKLFSICVSLFELFSARQVAGQEMRKSVLSHFGHSKGVVTLARAVRVSPGATPEAQGGRSSGRTEGHRVYGVH